MTKSGTFVINGAERVIVSQLQRSPGVFFDQSFHPNGTKIFQARIIPFRGSWVDFTTDIYDCIYAIIDRRRKFPATLLLRALGFSTNKDIFSSFGLTEKIKLSKKAALKGKTLIEDFVNEDTGEIVFEYGQEVDEDVIKGLLDLGLSELEVVTDPDSLDVQMLNNTLEKDPTRTNGEALMLLYQHLRTGEAPTLDIAQKFIEKMFFSTKIYDLGAVGRYRINKKFDLKASLDDPVLTKDDFINVFQYLMSMRNGEKGSDDIDHLGNRRI
jgi:DNA-directed RNA polymerase subunit beta